MAIWTSSITPINVGFSPNDGTGDSIHDAFTYVDTNFQNISTFLASDTIQFSFFVANGITVSNAFIANTTGTISSFTGNSTVGNLISQGGVYASSPSVFNANINVAGNVVPIGTAQYDLGSPTNRFRNFYISGAIYQGAAAQTIDAGQLVVHANSTPGDVKDVGVIGNVSHHYPANTYAFFGYQYNTNNFVYKITPTNAATGNGVIYDGVYGNAQLGGLFLSNSTISSTPSTGTLIVNGGAGIGGDVNIGGTANIAGIANVTGNIYTSGNVFTGFGQVVTTNMLGFGAIYQGGLVTGDTYFLSSTPSNGIGSGAVKINGGLSVAGNINTAGFVGPLWGPIQTAAQPNITSLGVLPTLTANSIQATSIGINSLTAAGGTVSFQTFTASGNVTVANIAATQFNGTLQGLVALPAQPLITSVGTLTSLAVASNVTVPNLVATNTNTTNVVATNIYTSNYLWPNGAPYVTTVANTADITANVNSGYNIGSSLTPTGVIAGMYGANTNTLVTTVDTKGRVSQLTQIPIAPISLSGTTGFANANSTVSVGGGITFSSQNGIVVVTTPGVISISTGQNLQNTSSPQFGNLSLTNNLGANNVVAAGNVTASVGYIGNVQATNVTATTITGTLQTASQPNITSHGTLTALAVSGSTNLAATTVTGNLSITGPAAYVTNNLYVGGSLFVQGNSIQVNATNVTTNDLQYIAAANAGSIGAADGAGLATPYGSILLSATNNAWISNIGFRATSIYDNGNRVVSTTSGTGNLTISGTGITLTPIGPGVTTVGSLTNIPTVSIDSFGRVTNLTQTAIQNLSTTASPTFAGLTVNGTISATGDITAYFSDDRLKTRLGTIENALDKIDSLTGFYYEANETAQELGYEAKREVGVSAQDTNGVMPELVAPAPISNEYLTVKYDRFAPLLIEGIKELRKELRDIKRHLGLE